MQALKQVNKRLSTILLQRFGGGGHDVVIPKLDLDQTWIKSGQFDSLEGFEDLHHHPHADNVHPYAHLVGKSIFSFERMYFSDAYYHEDEHEDLMNLPHGYMTNDDPLDSRSSFDIPSLEIVFIGQIMVMVGLFYGIHGLEFRTSGEKLYQDGLTVELLEDEIRNIRIQNQSLESKRDELKSRLGQ